MTLTCPYLSQFSFLKHAYFGIDSVSSQYDQAIETMAGCPLPLVTLEQVHGNQVIQVNTLTDEKKKGDGLVTNVKGVALGILTADCGSVLFYDPEVHVIGACHAGWRGAKDGILQATLDAMEEIGANRSRIYATLGPTIHQKNYEVGPEFPDLINASYDTYFYPSENKGHHYFNLPHYICQQLLREGLAKVHNMGRDTFSENFASRRRYLSEGREGIKSYNLSAIAII